MSGLRYDAVIPKLFSSLPEAKVAYDLWDMPGDPLPYIVFGFLEESFFTPAILADRDSPLLVRIFAFLEEMAASQDTKVVELLWVGLFEAWAADSGTFQKALSGMGPRTKKLAKKAANKLK